MWSASPPNGVASRAAEAEHLKPVALLGPADPPRLHRLSRFDPGAVTPLVRWRESLALGHPERGGRLLHGVELPSHGRDFFTWDGVRGRSPNPAWRRVGTDRLVRTTLQALAEYRRANPGAPRVAVGDLSRPGGGDFGAEFGGLGHRSHQNGLDVDVYYPRRDRRERAPESREQIDLRLAQELVDRFVRAGATRVYVGPGLGLGGAKQIVKPLDHHHDHLHVRIPPERPRGADRR